MNDLSSLLKTIDDRTKKNIPEDIVRRISMVVTSVVDDAKAKVKIIGYDSEYTLLNKSGFVLSSGDNVVVESASKDLNNGLIVFRFGENTKNFESQIIELRASLSARDTLWTASTPSVTTGAAGDLICSEDPLDYQYLEISIGDAANNTPPRSIVMTPATTSARYIPAMLGSASAYLRIAPSSDKVGILATSSGLYLHSIVGCIKK